MDAYDQLAEFILAIKADKDLKKSFLKILQSEYSSSENRVEKLRHEIASLNPPESVLTLLKLLQNDKIAFVVYQELKK